MAAMTVRYPVAASAEAALSAPLGRAVRQREAEKLASADVEFRVEEAGPAFASREAALDAFAGRLEDDRPGKPSGPAAEDRFLTLRKVVARTGGRLPIRAPARPSFEDGHRWPGPPDEALPTLWRVSVSYWKLRTAEEIKGQAREARRAEAGAALGREALTELSRRPLRPIKPQQPLDIGLFEAPLPESPGHYIPDE